MLASGRGLEPARTARADRGNPFYMTEVAQSGMGEVPPSARDAVLARVTRLSSPAREVLDVAALIGTRVDLRLLTAVSDVPVAGAG